MEPMKPFTVQSDAQSVQGTFDAESAHYSAPGWSWGGFIAWQIFAIGLRKYWYLFLALLVFIPFVGLLLILGIMIYFGMKGREMAANSTVFSNREQYIGFMKGADHAGKVFFFLMVGMIAIAFFIGVGIAIFTS